MRVLVGLIILAAGICGPVVLLPLLESRLSQPKGDGKLETEPAPFALRPVLVRQPLLAFNGGYSAPAATIPPSQDQDKAVMWITVMEFARSSSGGRKARPVPSSQVAPSTRRAVTPGSRLTSSKPADADARRELTRDLQRELKRVGCYEGEINGRWGAEAKRAMSAFTDRVNATLPVEEPDFILLALVQGHPAPTCGNSCPAGQELTNGGRCLPRTIVARRSREDADRAGPRSGSGQQASADQRAAEVVAQREVVSASTATVPSGDTVTHSGALGAPFAPAARMAVGAAAPATGSSAATNAALPDRAATASSTLTARPKPRLKPLSLGTSHRTAVAARDKTAAAQRDGRLSASKKVRSAERLGKRRLFASRAPRRATPPAYRTGRRSYASRLALAAWWRRYQYAVYGYGGMGGAWR
jgi:hypothetical protein